MLHLEWIVLYVTLGSLVGFLAGLLGAGGGGILVPVLAPIYVYQGITNDMSVHLAVGTALACMIISSSSSVRAHTSRGNVDWKIVRSMAPGIIVGAFIVTRLAAHVHSAVISLCFALMMGFIAWQYFFDWQPRTIGKPASRGEMLGVGTGIGMISALVAAGSGFLTVIYLGFKKVDIKRAIGTSAAIGLPIAVAGTIGYLLGGWSATADTPYTLGYIYVPAFLSISITSSIAAPIGARFAHRLPGLYLKRVFAVIALAMAIKMLISSV